MVPLPQRPGNKDRGGAMCVHSRPNMVTFDSKNQNSDGQTAKLVASEW